MLYEVITGEGTALFGVSIQPDGLVLNVPITITFSWDDTPPYGTIDDTHIQEENVIIISIKGFN